MTPRRRPWIGASPNREVWVDDDAPPGNLPAHAPNNLQILAPVPEGARRRIFHLAKHVGYGSGSVHVAVDLACLQAAAGHDVTFLSGGGTFVELLVSQGVKHVTLTQDQKRPFASLTALRRLVGLARARRPDVIHAHMMGSTLLGYVASRACGAPLVTTVHIRPTDTPFSCGWGIMSSPSVMRNGTGSLRASIGATACQPS